MLALGEPIHDLIGLAVRAWKADASRSFHCDHANSICGFAGRFNEIRGALNERPAGSHRGGREEVCTDRGWENGVFTGKGLSEARLSNYTAGHWNGKGDKW